MASPPASSAVCSMDAMVDDCGLCVDEVRALQVFLSLCKKYR
jgi:hypothetical protein